MRNLLILRTGSRFTASFFCLLRTYRAGRKSGRRSWSCRAAPRSAPPGRQGYTRHCPRTADTPSPETWQDKREAKGLNLLGDKSLVANLSSCTYWTFRQSRPRDVWSCMINDILLIMNTHFQLPLSIEHLLCVATLQIGRQLLKV